MTFGKYKFFLILFIYVCYFSGCSSGRKMMVGEQIAQNMIKEITMRVDMGYLLYLPQEYDSVSADWPVLFFLHGIGERGSDLEKVKTHGPPKLIAEGRQFPFIVVSPQCPDDQWWSADILKVLVEDISDTYRVDRDRMYLTGLSMGGYGTWALASGYPELFAAIAPVCGGGKTETAGKLRSMPVWIFHGAEDLVVPLNESQKMADALTAAGNPPKFTVYKNVGHDAWTQTYENDELYEWLLEQKK
jgi:predicted peptidase